MKRGRRATLLTSESRSSRFATRHKTLFVSFGSVHGDVECEQDEFLFYFLQTQRVNIPSFECVTDRISSRDDATFCFSITGIASHVTDSTRRARLRLRRARETRHMRSTRAPHRVT